MISNFTSVRRTIFNNQKIASTDQDAEKKKPYSKMKQT